MTSVSSVKLTPDRPKGLDLYACQGGAWRGYTDAGFEMYGVELDKKHQRHYPGPMHIGSAIDVLVTLHTGGKVDFHHKDGRVEWLGLSDFAFIHASPPCQKWSKAQRIQGNDHPDLIMPTRGLLIATGLPYVIENVEDARPELRDPVTLCGAPFGLRTYRHRLFETDWPLATPGHPEHIAKTTKMGRRPKDGEFMHVVGNFTGADLGREVMGMPWATRDGLREAIPPAYTEHIGRQLIAHLIERAA